MRVHELIDLLGKQDPEMLVMGIAFDGYIMSVKSVQGESQTMTVWLKLEDY